MKRKNKPLHSPNGLRPGTCRPVLFGMWVLLFGIFLCGCVQAGPAVQHHIQMEESDPQTSGQASEGADPEISTGQEAEEGSVTRSAQTNASVRIPENRETDHQPGAGTEPEGEMESMLFSDKHEYTASTKKEGEEEMNQQPKQTTRHGAGSFEIQVNGRNLQADFHNNASADAFRALLEQGPITISMNDYGHFEKVGDLPQPLVTSDETITTRPGDVILYQGTKITIYYDQNTWNFSRLGAIRDAETLHLKELLGVADVEVTFTLGENQ